MLQEKSKLLQFSLFHLSVNTHTHTYTYTHARGTYLLLTNVFRNHGKPLVCHHLDANTVLCRFWNNFYLLERKNELHLVSTQREREKEKERGRERGRERGKEEEAAKEGDRVVCVFSLFVSVFFLLLLLSFSYP